jgi:hypothetical protein
MVAWCAGDRGKTLKWNSVRLPAREAPRRTVSIPMAFASREAFERVTGNGIVVQVPFDHLHQPRPGLGDGIVPRRGTDQGVALLRAASGGRSVDQANGSRPRDSIRSLAEEC